MEQLRETIYIIMLIIWHNIMFSATYIKFQTCYSFVNRTTHQDKRPQQQMVSKITVISVETKNALMLTPVIAWDILRLGPI